MIGKNKSSTILDNQIQCSVSHTFSSLRKTMWACMLFVLTIIVSCGEEKVDYVCKPCDLPCDELAFAASGICPHCNMDLIKKIDLVPEKPMVINQIYFEPGSGKFLIEGGFIKEKSIVVHYYMPSNFESDSKVLIVLPGAGRNGDDYRNAWIENSEKYGVLVLSLEYSELHYPGFWSYNLGGMITDVNVQDMTFGINQNANGWIYRDFDRLFHEVQKALSLTTDEYDMFGHSAGGQILHRFAIFNPKNKANRILASNSGWYTIPTDEALFPYGLKDLDTTEEELEVSFNSKLFLFLGEKDNASETRGSLRSTPEADKQGLHRLERGIYFYNQSKIIADRLNFDSNWKLEIIPGIGHDHQGMSNAAAEFLYASPK